jgi:peptidoglycan hydrolase-like protein with peptidoglycan-binding domain
VKSLFRFTMVLMAVVLLVPVPGASAKKRGSRHGDRTLKTRLGDRTLKQGDSGSDVRALQKLLTRAGLKTGADGEFGSGTTENVKAFEASQRRPVDGVVTHTDAIVLADVAKNGGAVQAAGVTGGALPKNMAPPTPPPPPPLLTGPGFVATVNPDGTATAPALAPLAIQAIINAGNQIATKPYIYGGGHGKWEDAGYDCSGSVSYALHGALLLTQALTSGDFESWGDAGPGQWVTIYANGGHVYAVIAGLRFDTSGRSGSGTRWQPASERNGKGYVVRHPTGL